MLTLNQIISKLQEIQENHAQLNDFRFGNPADYGSEDSILYPMLGAWLEPSVLSKRQFTTKLRLYVVDLVNQGASDELPEIGMRNEVLSDKQLILLDVYAQLWEYFDDNSIELSPDASISHLEGAWLDNIYGWQSEIDVRQFYSRDTCQVPLKQEDAPDVTPYLTTSLTIENNGDDIYIYRGSDSPVFSIIAEGLVPDSGNITVFASVNLDVFDPVTDLYVTNPNSFLIPYENGRLSTERAYKLLASSPGDNVQFVISGGGLTYSQTVITY